MKATLVLHEKFRHATGIVELMIWQVPEPIPPSLHGFKYRLAFAVNGKRMVGYDNERGKGDHKHLRDKEAEYAFKDVVTLLADFWNDVEAAQ